MLKSFFALAALTLLIGCATSGEYNPVQSALNETFLLNEGLKNAQIGMSQKQVHEMLGQELVIGYSYADSGLKESPVPTATAITIANPYRTKDVHTAQGNCSAEYYVTSIKNPDGTISDDELMPLVFCKGILTGKGWDQVK